MASMLSSISGWFWSDQVWLPPGYTWSSFNSPQLSNNKTVLLQPGDFAKFSDLLYPLPLALCLILVRLALQRALLRPLAARLGLKSRRRPCHQHNDQLETAFRSSSSLSRGELARLSTESGLSAIEVNIFSASPNIFNKYLSRSRDGSETGGGPTSQTPVRSSVRRHSGLFRQEAEEEEGTKIIGKVLTSSTSR